MQIWIRQSPTQLKALVVQPDALLSTVKALAAEGSAAAASSVVVYGGRVLDEEERLCELAITVGATLYVLPLNDASLTSGVISESGSEPEEHVESDAGIRPLPVTTRGFVAAGGIKFRSGLLRTFVDSLEPAIADAAAEGANPETSVRFWPPSSGRRSARPWLHWRPRRPPWTSLLT
jgi:hypothetical protein